MTGKTEKDWQFRDGWHLCIMMIQTFSWFGCKWSSSSVSESESSSIWLAPEDCNLCGLVLSFLNAQQTQKASFVWWGKGWTIPQGCRFALDWPAACLVHHSCVQWPMTRCVLLYETELSSSHHECGVGVGVESINPLPEEWHTLSKGFLSFISTTEQTVWNQRWWTAFRSLTPRHWSETGTGLKQVDSNSTGRHH